MPATASSTRARSPHVRPEDLLQAFEGPIPPVPVSPFYMLGLLIVALAMVLLPMVYLGLLGAVGYGLFYHATENIDILAGAGAGSPRGSAKGRFLVYVAPLIVGGIAFLFMLKPLFSRRSFDDRRISLTRKGEPLLYGYIEALCQQLRAPVPRRIDVDMAVNASASFRRGMLSFLGNDLVLTIGLPLASGMSLRELTGVMAHEFGHFTQGMAMRLTYVIRTINEWFARVVYERDAWDERLDGWTQGAPGSLYVIGHLARFFVWLTRRLLWCLMMAGHTLSCFMCRQMEFDADCHQVRVAGSAAFAGAFAKLVCLDAANGKANTEMNQMLADRKLPDSYPTYLQSVVDRMPRQIRDLVVNQLETRKTGWFDTHPATGERIRRAREEDSSGILRLDAPASVLFTDFEGLCREATRISYDRTLGEALNGVRLVPVVLAKIEQDEAQDGYQAMGRYLQRLWLNDRPLGLRAGEFEPPVGKAEAVARLKRCRAKIEEALPTARKLMRKYSKAWNGLSQYARARALLETGMKIDAASFNLKEGTREAARAAEATDRRLIDQIRDKFALVDAVQRKRLMTALALLSDTDVAGRLENPARLRSEAAKHTEALTRLDAARETVDELRRCRDAVGTMIEALQQDNNNQRALGKLRDLAPQIREWLITLQSRLETDPYPFEHPEPDMSIGRWAVEVPAFPDDFQQHLAATETAIDRLNQVYFRLVSRLTLIAERVEKAVGLEPLPEPVEEDSAESK